MQDSEQASSNVTIGWVSSPDGRGTLDILYSCLLTIFLCTSSVLCVNVPAADDSSLRIFIRKMMLVGLGLLGPEFIFQALGQWMSARDSVRSFRNSGHTDWTMKHGFFAHMGGIMLQCPQFPAFPIDAKQTLYLIEHNYIEYPNITKKDIDDRDKVDPLLRIIIVCQITWFVINCVARGITQLTMTTLELTTIGFIFCTFGTQVFWAQKPADVQTPIILSCEKSISEILKNAGDAARKPYNHTPLDFVSRKEWSWSLC